MLAKLIDGALSYAPKKMHVDGRLVYNPPDDLLKEQGYKDVETSAAPQIATKTQRAMSSWADQGDKIVQSWTIAPAQPDPQEALREIQTETGYPRECIQAYDGTVQQDWTIDTPTLWKPWHSRKPEYALPWEQPTGAHDMYLAGEYMIWTDGTVKHCLENTNFSPAEYPQAWEDA